jgi:predicted nucleic acid-binding protein
MNCRRSGKGCNGSLLFGANDLWLAAHALAIDLMLVTSNEREFKRVAGLKIQNWASYHLQ